MRPQLLQASSASTWACRRRSRKLRWNRRQTWFVVQPRIRPRMISIVSLHSSSIMVWRSFWNARKTAASSVGEPGGRCSGAPAFTFAACSARSRRTPRTAALSARAPLIAFRCDADRPKGADPRSDHRPEPCPTSGDHLSAGEARFASAWGERMARPPIGDLRPLLAFSLWRKRLNRAWFQPSIQHGAQKSGAFGICIQGPWRPVRASPPPGLEPLIEGMVEREVARLERIELLRTVGRPLLGSRASMFPLAQWSGRRGRHPAGCRRRAPRLPGAASAAISTRCRISAPCCRRAGRARLPCHRWGR